MQAGSDQSRDVGHVDEEQGVHPVGDRRHALEIDDAGIGTGSSHDEFGPDIMGLALQRVVVDATVGLRYSVAMHIEEAPAEVDGVTMGQMTTMGQAHAEDGVSVVEHREIGGDVGLGTRMGLHVDELCPGKELQCSVLGESLGDIDELTAAVVARPGLTLGVLVVEP